MVEKYLTDGHLATLDVTNQEGWRASRRLADCRFRAQAAIALDQTSPRPALTI
jgi:hypothetical protein